MLAHIEFDSADMHFEEPSRASHFLGTEQSSSSRMHKDHQRSGEPVEHSHLLALPRELRDLVLLHLCHEVREPPDNPDQAGPRNPSSPSTPCTIYFEARSPKPALLQLKLCNKQLHREVHDILRKTCNDAPGQAVLDIMVKSSSIWPTWISLPTTSRLDPVININLRIFESEGLGSEFSTGAYRVLWSFFNRLVFQGTACRRNLTKPLAVDSLRFDITLCFPTSVDDLFGTYRDVFDRLEKLAYDNVGLGHVGMIEAHLGADRRAWKLKQLPTGLTFPSRQ